MQFVSTYLLLLKTNQYASMEFDIGALNWKLEVKVKLSKYLIN
jgi:hypothetical protein